MISAPASPLHLPSPRLIGRRRIGASGPMSSATMASVLSSTWSGGWTRSLRYDRRRRRGWDWNGKRTRRVGSPLPPAIVSPTLCSRASDPCPGSDLKILKIAREKFAQEISFKSKDKDVSLARALLYVAAEDEAFMAFHRDMDVCSFVNERKDTTVPFKDELEVNNVEDISLAGKNVSGWLNELDTIAKEVEAELVSRDIGCHLEEVLEAVNAVLFESRSFKRFPASVDSKFSYLHRVLSCGYGSAIMLSIIYIEICRRLDITIVGSCVGEGFLIWPQTGNPEELFRASSGRSLFAMINGSCVEDPSSRASDLNSKSLSGLDIATNRDIIGIALANLIRLHWKRASRANHGLMLTSPLRPVHPGNDRANMAESSRHPLLRPQELRLAVMASERLLILQPHNWRLRRDHGMLLYFSRRYGEAVQELSICMAFAPVEEAEVLEPFVEKLHLLRLLSSWESLEQTGSVPIP